VNAKGGIGEAVGRIERIGKLSGEWV